MHLVEWRLLPEVKTSIQSTRGLCFCVQKYTTRKCFVEKHADFALCGFVIDKFNLLFCLHLDFSSAAAS